MTNRSRAEVTWRGLGDAKSSRAYGDLSRVAGFVRASVEVARATDWLATIARQQSRIAARGLFPRTRRGAEIESTLAALEGRAGSQTSSEGNRRRGESGDALQFMSANAMRAIHGFASKVKTFDAAVRAGASAAGGRAIDGMHISRKTSRENSDSESRPRDTDTKIDPRGRFSRMIQQSSSGMEALTRIRNSGRVFGLGGDPNSAKGSAESRVTGTERESTLSWSDLAGRANRALGVVGRLSIGGEESSQGSGPRFDRSRTSTNFDRVLTSAGKYISASSARGWGRPTSSMVAPASLSRPEFAEPMRGVYGQESRSTPGSITINSTPTVVINACDASSDVERQVIGALRAHREELFDQFRREAVRRERAQF